jgi:hypothetical protein
VPGDLSNRGQQDRSRISLQERHEVDYWTKRFGVSKDQLEAAVKAVATPSTPWNATFADKWESTTG